MTAWQILLEIGLVGLLAATLFHALRLERALGVVRRDRAELETMLGAFNESTRQAENATERLRGTADGAGRQIARQLELAANLKEDLAALIERGDRLADRVDRTTRPQRDLELVGRRFASPDPEPADAATGTRVRSQAERDLLRALKVTR